MKKQNFYVVIGLIVMVFALISFDKESDTFLRIFGVGIGIALPGIVIHIINGIMYFISILKDENKIRSQKDENAR
jgi:hypothetical protein